MTFDLRGGCTTAQQVFKLGRRPETSLVDSWQPTPPEETQITLRPLCGIDVNHGMTTSWLTISNASAHRHLQRETKLKATLHWNILWGSNTPHSAPFEMGFLAISVLSGLKILANLIKRKGYSQGVFLEMGLKFLFCISDISEKVLQNRVEWCLFELHSMLQCWDNNYI